MRLLITGICGFVGYNLTQELMARRTELSIVGVDNLSRPGSEVNCHSLRRLGIRVIHGDLRLSSDVAALPRADFVIDAAANPSVLSGIASHITSRQLMEHNLGGTINILEYCRHNSAGMILLSSSRVYSIKALAAVPLAVARDAFQLNLDATLPHGLSPAGISEDFPTTPPLSLYGATKLTSELLAMEYSSAFTFPLFINRCGILAGPGQFGRPDQGIFAYWIHSWKARRPLRYIGFGGTGHQVRDCLHPRDLADLLDKQLTAGAPSPDAVIVNVGGGPSSARSLQELSRWCELRLGHHPVDRDSATRPYDLPWIVLDIERVNRFWDWRPTTSPEQIFEELALHATRFPDWAFLAQ